jgi:transcriptional regulator GlxA family with amidase domain
MASAARWPSGTLRVVLLAYESMDLLDLAGCSQALTIANRSVGLGAKPRYKTIMAAERGGPVLTRSGLPMVTVPVFTMADTAIDILIAPGGYPGRGR